MTPADWRDSLRAMLPADYQPTPEDSPAEPKAAPWPKLVVTLDRKRAGKTATIISGFSPDDPRCQELAIELKKKFACGGSARGGEILLQGDLKDKVQQYLDQLRAKRKHTK